MRFPVRRVGGVLGRGLGQLLRPLTRPDPQLPDTRIDLNPLVEGESAQSLSDANVATAPDAAPAAAQSESGFRETERKRAVPPSLPSVGAARPELTPCGKASEPASAGTTPLSEIGQSWLRHVNRPVAAPPAE